jgi:type II secretion system protein N
MMLSAFQWRIVKLIGYPLFFLACFGLFLVWTFPVERFAPEAETRLSAFTGREVKVGGASMSLTGALVLFAVEIGLAPDEGGDEPQTPAAEADGEKADAAAKPVLVPKYTIDELTVSVGFLDLLFGQLDVELDAELLGGELSIAYDGPLGGEGAGAAEDGPAAVKPAAAIAARRAAQRALAGKKGAAAETGVSETPAATNEADDEPMELSIAATGIQLRQIHDLRRKSPVPIAGAVDLKLDLRSETGRFADADGHVSVGISQFVLGDGKNPSTIGGMPITVDEIVISEIAIELDVKKGTATVEKSELKSTDFAAAVEGTIALADPLSRSRLDLYLRFKFLDGYTNKSPTAKMLVSTLPEVSNAFKRSLRTDGFFGFRYRGLFGAAQFSPAKSFRGKADKERDRAERKARRSSKARKNAAQAPGPTEGGQMMPPESDESDRQDKFPDLKPPMGNGRFGVDPAPPPARSQGPAPIAEEPQPEVVEPPPEPEVAPAPEPAEQQQPEAPPEEGQEQATEGQAEDQQGQEEAPTEEQAQ